MKIALCRLQTIQQSSTTHGDREVKVDIVSVPVQQQQQQQVIVNGSAHSVPMRVSPVKKTTAELEAQHEELDAILRELLSHDASASRTVTTTTKSLPPRGGLVSETTETVTTWEAAQNGPTRTVAAASEVVNGPAAASATQSAVRVETRRDVVENTPVTGPRRRFEESQQHQQPVINRAPTPPTSADRIAGPKQTVADYRSYASDSEDPIWLDEQRARMQRSSRRTGTWRERTVRERQLVAELQSAQNALATIRAGSVSTGFRPRAQSESDSLDRSVGATTTSSYYTRNAPLDRSADYSDDGRREYRSSTTARRTSELSGSQRSGSGRDGGYDVEPGHFVSGLERPPYTTQQTVYTFSVSPQRTASLENGLSSNYSTINRASPGIPERKDSSREAVLRSRNAILQGTLYVRRYWTVVE